MAIPIKTTVECIKECDSLIKETRALPAETTPGQLIQNRVRKIVDYLCSKECLSPARAIGCTAYHQDSLKEKNFSSAPYKVMIPKDYTMNETTDIYNNPPNSDGKFTFYAKDTINNKDVIIKKFNIGETKGQITKETMEKKLYYLREIAITTHTESPIICQTIGKWMWNDQKKVIFDPSKPVQDMYQMQEIFGETSLDEFFKYYHIRYCERYGNHKFSKQYIQQLFHDLISGLKDVHDLGVIHRNLTTKNIRMDIKDLNNHTVKITNFDKSRKLDVEKVEGTDLNDTAMQLSMDDCAPELYFCAILRDNPDLKNIIENTFKYTNKVDIYSLGLVFCRVLMRKNLIAYLGFDTLHIVTKTEPIEARVKLALFNFFGKLTEDQAKIVYRITHNNIDLVKETYTEKGYFKGKAFQVIEGKSALENIMRERCEKSSHLKMDDFKIKENGGGDRKEISNTWVSDAIELVVKMLSLNAIDRPSAEEALKHKFFNGFKSRHDRN